MSNVRELSLIDIIYTCRIKIFRGQTIIIWNNIDLQDFRLIKEDNYW